MSSNHRLDKIKSETVTEMAASDPRKRFTQAEDTSLEGFDARKKLRRTNADLGA